MRRRVREHKKGIIAHLKPVEPVGRLFMGGGGGKGEEGQELWFGPKRAHIDRCSNVGGLNFEASPPAEARRCIRECVPPGTERNQPVSIVSKWRTGRPYGVPLVAVA